jgi:hypothetical protein
MPELSTVLDDTQFPAYASGGKSRSLADRLTQGAVCINEMTGFVGNGTSDDLIPVNAAIAKAIADGKGAIIRPAGCNIAVSAPVFLGMAADPTNAAYSLALLTPDGTHGNHNGQGAWFPLTNNFHVIKVGPGQMMMVCNQTVRGTGAALTRGLQDPASAAFSVAAESGGCSGFTFAYNHALSVHTMFDIGGFGGGGALADSGYFEFNSGSNLAVGYKFRTSQAYIHTIVHNRVNDCKLLLDASLGHNIAVLGGNWSGVSGKAKLFNIANVSALTAAQVGNGRYYTFTAEVTNPDADLEAGFGKVYDDAYIEDAHWGLIPLTIVGYNASTNIISLETQQNWSFFYGQETNLKTGSNLEARIQAATTLGAGERLTTFLGTGINQTGTMHMENGAGYTRWIDASAGFQAGLRMSTFENVYFNYDPVNDLTDGDPTAAAVKKKLARCQPLIRLANGGVKIKNIDFSQIGAAPSPFVIETNGAHPFHVESMQRTVSPIVRCYSGGDPWDRDQAVGNSGFGDGEWYPTPFLSSANSSDNGYRTGGNRTKHWGWLPAMDSSPRLTPAQVTTLTGTLPTFVTGGNVTYPLIAGGVKYSIGTPAGNDSDDISIKSKHRFYSYGQDLTTTNITNLAWSFRGRTRKLNLNTEAIARMFPGLCLILSHASIDAGAPWECVVTAVDRQGLWVEVSSITGGVAWLLPGVAGTEYTGTSIGQPPYAFRKARGETHIAPTITVPSTLSNMEGTKLAVPLTATSGITAETFTWSISGGADGAKCEVDNDTKLLRWTLNGVKDFGAPDDAGANNVYNITLRAIGDISGLTTDKAIAITVGDYNAGAARDIVVDADLWQDCDDAGALGVAMQLDDNGSINIMGVICSCTGNSSGPAARAMLNHYGFPGVPVGTNRATVPAPGNNVWTDEVAARFGVAGQLLRTDFLTDGQMWRMVLATAPRKVTAVMIGGHQSAMRLLNSVPDSISPLSGPDLILEKVERLYVMGGDYPSGGPETNLAMYPSGSDELANRWPTPIVWHGVDLGQGVLTGPPNTRDPLLDPIRHAYVEFGVDEQSSWDPFCMYNACLGASTNFNETGGGANGTNVVNPNTGANSYTAATGGNDNVATKVETDANLRTAVNALLSTLTAP